MNHRLQPDKRWADINQYNSLHTEQRSEVIVTSTLAYIPRSHAYIRHKEDRALCFIMEATLSVTPLCHVVVQN